MQRLIDAAQDIVPLRARRERLRQPVEAVAICKFQSKEISIQKVTHSFYSWLAIHMRSPAFVVYACLYGCQCSSGLEKRYF